MPKARQIRSATSVGALADHQARAARLTPRTYVVVRGTAQVPTGTTVVEYEDPGRATRGPARPLGAAK